MSTRANGGGRSLEEPRTASTGQLPLVIHAPEAEMPLASWLPGAWNELRGLLDRHGALLLEGFALADISDFRAAVASVTPDLLDYDEPSTPRREIAGKVFTSTEYPPDQTIPLHNESSYRRSWPQLLWFWCARAAQRGGETTLADFRSVYADLAGPTREAFETRGVMYERRFNQGFDLTWQHVFGTSDRNAVDAMLRQPGQEHRWLEHDGLYTSTCVEAVLRHPRTGEKTWFNQAHLFHPSSLHPDVRAGLEAAVGAGNMPRMARFGDGSPIDEALLTEIRATIDAHTVRRPWSDGEVLLIDNLSVAHGRSPFVGERKVYVAMAGAMHSSFLPQTKSSI